MKTGVYGIYYNERLIYIGSASRSFQDRWRIHKRDLINNKHHAKYLQRIYNKYGNVFEFKILEKCLPENCIQLEQIYLDSYWAEGLANGSPTAGSPRGVVRSIRTRKKISLAVKASWLNPVLAEKMKGFKKGHTPANKGKKASLELRKKLSQAHSGKPRPNRVGKPTIWTEESKRAFREKRQHLTPHNKGINGLEYTSFDKTRKKWHGLCIINKKIIIKKRFNTQLDAYLAVYTAIAIHNKEYCEVKIK